MRYVYDVFVCLPPGFPTNPAIPPAVGGKSVFCEFVVNEEIKA